MGIDREAIATAIFKGTRTPATSVIAPDDRRRPRGRLRLLPSRRRRANALLDVARFDRSKPIEPWFNADAGLDARMEAVGNQLRRNLGVNYVLPEPAELPRAAVLDQRTAPGGANLSFCSNPVFDQLVGEGDQAQSNAEAIAKYNQAEDVLLEDMPIIPMFFQVEQSLFSEHVSDVTVDIFGRIDAAEVTVND
jgi:oligopeptide transport system substrate-binding protein